MSATAGVDIGRARDFTAIVLMDGMTVRGVHRLRLGQDWSQIIAGIVRLTAGCTHIAMDASGVGNPVVEAVARQVTGTVIPIIFTAQSKATMIQALVAAVSGGRLQIDPYAPGREDLKEELRTFLATPSRTGWRFSGKQNGLKDDIVIALALAIQASMYAQTAPQGTSGRH